VVSGVDIKKKIVIDLFPTLEDLRVSTIAIHISNGALIKR
jgi:hypothetical protein